MRNRLALLVALSALAVAGVFYLFHNPPGGAAPYPACVFRETTGLYCAGCGGTRAAHALVHGRLGTALAMNPLLVIGLPFLAVGCAIEASVWLWGERYRGPRVRLRGALIWLVPAAVISFWVLRNLPWWPFTLLAPQ